MTSGISLQFFKQIKTKEKGIDEATVAKSW